MGTRMRSSDYGQVLNRTCESQVFGPWPASCRILRNKPIAREQKIRNRRFAGATVRRAAQRRLLDCRIGIQALVAHPKEAHTVFAGGDTGLFVSRDRRAWWERTSTNGALPTIWSLTIDRLIPIFSLPARARPGSIASSYGLGRGRNRWRLPQP